MGPRTSIGLDRLCVTNILSLLDILLEWLADLLTYIEKMGHWPRILAQGFIPLIPKDEGMLPMQQRPLFVSSQIYRHGRELG